MAKPSIPSNSFPDRVKFSFDENDQETCSKYLDWLFARITDYSQSLRRDVTFIILLIAAFELVADSKHVSIGFGSFQLSKGSIVLQFIPVVVSYLLFQTVVNTSRITLLITAFEAALADGRRRLRRMTYTGWLSWRRYPCTGMLHSAMTSGLIV